MKVAVPGTRRAPGGALLAVALATALAGCATYTDRVASAALAARGGDYGGALAAYGSLLGVQSSDEVPATLSGDKPLLLLDRGVLQQATRRWVGSQRDLSAAEQKLELLDLTRNPVATLGAYLYSDSAKTYKIPPVERLALNAVNLLNFLARGDLEGAKVEARRFQVMREYLDTIRARSGAPDRLGAYLAGFTFERAGEGDRALRYYDEALGGGALDTLVEPVSRLARSFPYRGSNIARVAGAAAGAGSRQSRPAEVLVVLGLGRVPYRVPQRIPVGAAVGVAGAMLGDRDLDILRYSAAKVLVYPELVSSPSLLGNPVVRIDGRDAAVEHLASLGAAVAAEYEEAKPKILAAALSRVAARAAAAEGMRAAGNQESQALGDVLSILFETTMVALDKPDTRSWTLLPDRVLVARVPVSPGRHEVSVSFPRGQGATRTETVDVADGGFAAVVVTEPR